MSSRKIKTSEAFAGVADKIAAREVLMNRAGKAAQFIRKGGSTFLAQEFAEKVKRDEIRIPPAINLTAAATTAFADGDFSFTMPSDRYGIVWGAGIEAHDLLTDNDVAIPDGPLRQLRAEGLLEFKFPNGKSVTRAYAQHDLGALNIALDGITTLIGAALPQELLTKRLKEGVVADNPVGTMNPTDVLTVSFTGLNGDTVEDSQSGVVLSLYLLIEEFPMS